MREKHARMKKNETDIMNKMATTKIRQESFADNNHLAYAENLSKSSRKLSEININHPW